MEEKLALFGQHLLRQPKFIFLLLIALVGLYLHGASLQNHLVNTDPGRSDQRSYLISAREMSESNYNYLVPRNRMPVYPLLQSLAYKSGMSEEEYFVVGKDFNTYLSLIILVIIYFLAQRLFSPLLTVNLMLITGFTVFMFKAPFFQVELLFYILNLGAFLMMIRLFRNPSIKNGVIAGLILGIAHMTKASVILGLLIFFGFMGLNILIDFLKRTPAKQIVKQKIVPLGLLLLTFIVSISVYISNSKKVYGHYFYNVNSTFYIWYDDWGQAIQGTRAHGDRVGWPDMPEEEIPGPAKYFREHSTGQIVERFRTGIEGILNNSIYSYGYFIYLAFYTILFCLVAIVNWRTCLALFKKHFVLVFFVAAYFLFYFLAVAWYVPINDGNRFILAYFLPYMFVLFYVFHSAKSYFANRTYSYLNVVHGLVLIFLAGHIYFIMTDRIGTFFGGR